VSCAMDTSRRTRSIRCCARGVQRTCQRSLRGSASCVNSDGQSTAVQASGSSLRVIAAAWVSDIQSTWIKVSV
jgi:hypothetical protein